MRKWSITIISIVFVLLLMESMVRAQEGCDPETLAEELDTFAILFEFADQNEIADLLLEMDGWLDDKLATCSGEVIEPIEEEEETPIAEETGTVEVRTVLRNANVRTCAATTCALAGQVAEGEALRINATVEGEAVSGSTIWYEATYQGETIYIHSSLVSEEVVPEADPGAPIESIALGGGEHLRMAFRRSEFRIILGDDLPERDLFLILFATLENSTNDEVCIYARDVHLSLDGQDQTPTSDVMSKVQDALPGHIDYIGENNGQCVDGGASAQTFVAFDVPFGIETAELRLYGEHERVDLGWPEDAAALSVTTLENAVWALIDAKVTEDVVEVTVNPLVPAVVASWEMREGWSGYDVGHTNGEMAEIACSLRNTGWFGGYRFVFTAKVNLVDSYGNVRVGNGLVVWLEAPTIRNINCDNVGDVNIERIADTYDLHQALR